jgi:hypothetical protein
MGEYSKQVMQNKKMRDMPVKRKVQEMGLQLGVAALTSPGTLRGVQSGVARGVNAVRGREVWVHSSPQQGLGSITPQVSPGGRPRFQKDTPLTFGVRAPAKGTQDYLPEYVKEITTAYNSRGALGTAGKPKSVYVTKVPKTNIVATEATGKWGVSSAPQKVVREISVAGKTARQLEAEIAAATKAAGQRLVPMKSAYETAKSMRALEKALAKAKKAPPRKRID